MKKDLSITIVAYHNYNDIKNAIDTIEQYTTKDIDKQIYIVDNSCNTTDKEKQEAKSFEEYISKYEDIEYLDTGKNLGFGKGHNYILDKLDSKYHAIVNPDVLLKDDAFFSIIKYLDENKDIGMCIPNITDEQGNRLEVYRLELTIFDMFIRMFCNGMFKKRKAKHTMQNMDYTKPFQVPFGQGSFLVIRTELYKKLQGFDDNFFMYLEDADLCKRVNQVSKLMYYPDATIIHKWEKGSHKNKTLFKYHISSMKYYFKKWGFKLF